MPGGGHLFESFTPEGTERIGIRKGGLKNEE
jgi:hypothetical protein